MRLLLDSGALQLYSMASQAIGPWLAAASWGDFPEPQESSLQVRKPSSTTASSSLAEMRSSREPSRCTAKVMQRLGQYTTGDVMAHPVFGSHSQGVPYFGNSHDRVRQNA